MSTAISDAEIIEETTSEKPDLLAELKKRTEIKTPDAVASAKAWIFDDEEDDDEIEPVTREIKKPETDPKKKPDPNKKEPTQKELEASAESGASIVDFFVSTVSEIAVNVRYNKKFTEEEKDILEEKVIDEDIEKLTEDEKRLRRKYERLESQKKKKLEAIEITEKKRKKLYDAFFAYAKVTGKTLGPEWIIVSAVVDVVIDTSIEAFTD